MTGKELRKRLKDDKANFAELSRKLGLDRPQNLYSRLKAKKLDIDFLRDISNFAYGDLRLLELNDTKHEAVINSPDHLQKEVIELKSRILSLEESIRSRDVYMKYVLHYINNEEHFIALKRFFGTVPLNDLSMCVANASGVLEYVNDEFVKQTGFSEKEALGEKPGKILQGDKTQKDRVIKMRQAIASQQRYEGEVINYSRMKSEITCKLIIVPVLDKLVSLAKFQ